MKSLALVSLFIFFSFTLSGQVTFGTKTGLQLVTAGTNTEAKPAAFTSYTAGLFGTYHLSRKISTTVEISYTDKGHRIQFVNDNSPDIFYHRAYLNIPILIQYHASPSLAFHLGGEFGFLLKSYASQYGHKSNSKSYFGNPFDFGIAAGTSYKLDSRFELIVRGTYGLSNVLAKNAYTKIVYGPYDIHLNARAVGNKFNNEVLQLSLNYSIFKLKPESVVPDTSVNKISWGVKVGVNINSVDREKSISYYNDEREIVGYGGNVGVYLSTRLSEKMNFIPEIQFIRKGYRDAHSDYVGNVQTNNLGLYYLELPLILSYNIFDIVNVDMGPVFGKRILVTEKTSDHSYPIAEFYKKNNFEFGLTGGLRFAINGNFSAACRYYRGFTNISNLYDYNFISEFNRTIQISTYYRISK